MDLETGEYYDADTETGEVSYKLLYNAETGEYEGSNSYFPVKKFKIPSSFTTENDPWKTKTHKLLKANKHELEFITAAIFLLPTMILFYPVLGIFAVALELMLHNWSHRKNRKLKNDTVYYQSPLHVIVREFCARCKEEDAKVKITKIQDIRNDKLKNYDFEYIRRIVT